jgi:hypothetical protein
MQLKIPLSSSGVSNCQTLNQVVESQFFTPLRNRFHQLLSGIELDQITAFFELFNARLISPCFSAGKQTGV